MPRADLLRGDSRMELIAAFFTVVLVVAGTFVVDAVARWWRQNEWKRRWRERDRDLR